MVDHCQVCLCCFSSFEFVFVLYAVVGRDLSSLQYRTGTYLSHHALSPETTEKGQGQANPKEEASILALSIFILHIIMAW
jgi:hypothetical protein